MTTPSKRIKIGIDNPEENTGKLLASFDEHLITRGSKATAKSTPVFEKTDESGSSPIESCTPSQSSLDEDDDEEEEKVRDFDPNNSLSKPPPTTALCETNLKMLEKRKQDFSHLISLMLP